MIMRNLKTLIIEDNQYKLQEIKNSLKFLGITDITHRAALNPGLFELRNSYRKNQPYDLLVLDMQFPIYEHEIPRPNAGIFVLDEIERCNRSLPVIICSSEEQNLTNYENIIGEVIYNSFVSLQYPFQEILETAFSD